MREVDPSDVQYMPVTFVPIVPHLNKQIPGFSELNDVDEVMLPDSFNFKSVVFDYFENIITEQRRKPVTCRNCECDNPVDYGTTWYFTNL